MYEGYRNIYRDARRASGLTQERWAEVLGLSVEAVRQYESFKIMPGDDIVLRMAELSGQHILCYWHLLNKSRVAQAVLPEVEDRPLPEAVLNLLYQVDAFKEDGLRKLIRIGADGSVAVEEENDFNHAVEQLKDLVRAAFGVTLFKE